MPTPRELMTQIANLRRQWGRLVQEQRQFLAQQANMAGFGGTASVSGEDAVNRALQVGGQQILDQIQRLESQVPSSTRERVILARPPRGGQTGQAVGGRPSGERPQVIGGRPQGDQGDIGQPRGERPLVQGGRPQGDQGDIGQQLITQFRQALNEANEANQERFERITEGFESLIGETTGALSAREERSRELLRGLGADRRAQINRAFDLQRSSAIDDLIARGLRGTTVAPTVTTGIEEARQRALGEQAGQGQRTRLGFESQLAGETVQAGANLGQQLLGFLERRQDQGPDFANLASLLQGLGQAGFGVGGPPQTGQQGGQIQQAPPLNIGTTPGVQAPRRSPTGFQTIPFQQFFGGGAGQNPILGMMQQFQQAGQLGILGQQAQFPGQFGQQAQQQLDQIRQPQNGMMQLFPGGPFFDPGPGFQPNQQGQAGVRAQAQGGPGANFSPQELEVQRLRQQAQQGQTPGQMGQQPAESGGGPIDFGQLFQFGGGGQQEQSRRLFNLPTRQARQGFFQGVPNPNQAGPASRMTLQRMQQMLQAGVPPTAIRRNMQLQAGAGGRGAPFQAPPQRLPTGGVAGINPPRHRRRPPLPGGPIGLP